MSERVAVYIDFDNVVISRYDDVHGKQAWRKDDPRQHGQPTGSKDPIDTKLLAARVDIGAVVDFAASFGSVSLSRAYADWSVPVNASYKTELIERSLHLVQLFNASGVKNGADIRLAVDAVEDLMRHPEITHVVLVAGDSDFVPLAQRRWPRVASSSAGTSLASESPVRRAVSTRGYATSEVGCRESRNEPPGAASRCPRLVR